MPLDSLDRFILPASRFIPLAVVIVTLVLVSRCPSLSLSVRSPCPMYSPLIALCTSNVSIILSSRLICAAPSWAIFMTVGAPMRHFIIHVRSFYHRLRLEGPRMHPLHVRSFTILSFRLKWPTGILLISFVLKPPSLSYHAGHFHGFSVQLPSFPYSLISIFRASQ